jgi:small conductance mechanosensitive channel
MTVQSVLQFITEQGATIGTRFVIAILVWWVGRRVIRFGMGLFKRLMERNGAFDRTLIRYLVSIVHVLLTVALLIGILDLIGIQTASLAALIAGIGLAIGTAVGGLLTHFAAGAFLQLLRPFKVGDVVTAGGVTGVVKELGLFNTSIVSGDNVLHYVGNNKIFSDNIQNSSAMPYRRVDCVCKVANSVDPLEAIEKLRTGLELVKNVKADPAPQIEIIALTLEGPSICVRPYAATEHHWQVMSDTHKMIVKVLAQAGYPSPATETIQRAH